MGKTHPPSPSSGVPDGCSVQTEYGIWGTMRAKPSAS